MEYFLAEWQRLLAWERDLQAESWRKGWAWRRRGWLRMRRR